MDTTITGCLRKMHGHVIEQQVHYTLYLHPIDPSERPTILPIQPLIGQRIRLRYVGPIHCIHCNRPTRKSFNQGYCFRCFRQRAECDGCIVRPERCHFHQGTCRDPAWGLAHCMQPHIVYLANTSHLKIGVTRLAHLPTRWIDQGAIQALAIFQTSQRYHAGLIEHSLKAFISDRTHWRTMLQGHIPTLNLEHCREQLLQTGQKALNQLQEQYPDLTLKALDKTQQHTFHYPVERQPQTITSIHLDRQPEVEGQLIGIKGQYWLLDSGVINIRKFAGHCISLTYTT